MKVFAFICVHEWETNTHARVEFVWNVHIQVMLKLISFSILNMHELVETWFSKFQDWQSNVYFPWPNELTICPDIDGFQIPLKASCTGHRLRKAKQLSKRLLCFLFRENLLGIVSRLLFFCSVTSSVPDTQNKCLNSHHNHPRPHLLHEFIVNVKHRMDWSYRKPYICLSFNFWKQYPTDGIWLTSGNMQKYVISHWLLWKRPIFLDLYRNSLTWKIVPYW